jgi:hypothetical protein
MLDVAELGNTVAVVSFSVDRQNEVDETPRVVLSAGVSDTSPQDRGLVWCARFTAPTVAAVRNPDPFLRTVDAPRVDPPFAAPRPRVAVLHMLRDNLGSDPSLQTFGANPPGRLDLGGLDGDRLDEH